MLPSFLIVDADRGFREATAIALRLDGHPAACSATVEDALAQLGRGDVGCCVVDAYLAGADQLLEAALRSGVRAVVTGTYPELLSGAARRHPRAELLAKPFRPTALLRPRSP